MRRDPLRRSEPDPPREHVFPHHPVAHEAVKRAAEGRRAVFLEEKVAHPRKRIAGAEAGEEPPEIQRGEGVERGHKAERRADEVQPPAGAIGVLRKIERVELGKTAVIHLVSPAAIVAVSCDDYSGKVFKCGVSHNCDSTSPRITTK